MGGYGVRAVGRRSTGTADDPAPHAPLQVATTTRTRLLVFAPRRGSRRRRISHARANRHGVDDERARRPLRRRHGRALSECLMRCGTPLKRPARDAHCTMHSRIRATTSPGRAGPLARPGRRQWPRQPRRRRQRERRHLVVCVRNCAMSEHAACSHACGRRCYAWNGDASAQHPDRPQPRVPSSRRTTKRGSASSRARCAPACL